MTGNSASRVTGNHNKREEKHLYRYPPLGGEALFPAARVQQTRSDQVDVAETNRPWLQTLTEALEQAAPPRMPQKDMAEASKFNCTLVTNCFSQNVPQM